MSQQFWRWLWKTSKTKTFSARQKQPLFKGHSTCTKIEQKKAAIFNLHSTTTTLKSKDHKGNLSTITVTSPTASSLESSNAIKSLENGIQYLHHQLNQIKKTGRIIYQRRIKLIIQVTHNQGPYIRQRINNITSNLNSFIRQLGAAHVWTWFFLTTMTQLDFLFFAGT